MPPKQWIRVYSSQNTLYAEIVVGVLREQGIEAHVVNKQDRSYLFGFVEVYVRMDQMERALQMIENEITFG